MPKRAKNKPAQSVSVTSEKEKYFFLIFFATMMFIAAFLFNTPSEIWYGNIVILTSPANLITDYFEIANIGAALVNASIMTFQAIAIIKINKLSINGMLVAAVFTVAGFSLFGKNLYNSFPIIMGVMAYAKFTKVLFRQLVPVALFGTALGPLVSEVTFNLQLPIDTGILLGILAGFVAGFFMPVLAQHFVGFHKGFSLYNMGFTAGIVGTFFIAILRSFGVEVNSVYLVYQGNNKHRGIFLFVLYFIMLIAGLRSNQWSFKGFAKLMKDSGQGKTDFINKYPYGLVLINMSLLGILATTYILLVGGNLNGPVLGGIFTIVGFGALGKHLKNVVPILIGIFLVGYFSIHDINSTAVLLAALFGTTLAPISGHYGPLAGVIAGGLHMILTTNITFLHAGMNLYNNGFSGGFIAAVMVPILDKVYERTMKNSRNIRE